MGAPRPLPAVLAPAALALGLLACSSAPQPVSPAKPARAPEAEPLAGSAAPAPPAPAPAAGAPAEPKPEKPPAAPASPAASAGGNVVVIDPGTEEGRPRSLVEAARAERERRAQAGEPTAVITNKSLAHSSGQLTHAQPKRTKAEAGGKAAAAPHDEAYWRRRGLDIRVRWRKSTEDVERLQQEAADLRRRFYSQADPAVRDAQIKPEWDRTLELLDKARLDIVAAKGELDAFMEEGRRAGALPGWLREGTDQEPEHKPAPPAPTDSIEPPILPPPPVLKDGPP